MIFEMLEKYLADTLLLTSMSDQIVAELNHTRIQKMSINWQPSQSLVNHSDVGIDYYESSRQYSLALIHKD